MELFQNTDFWLGLMLIIWINIILSGDNAVVIALAARSLPPEQQKKAIMFGSGAAVVLRIGLTVVAAKLMTLEYLQIVGGLLLLWIGAQLLEAEEEGDEDGAEHSSLFSAIRTILIADLVMSLDNVIAVAAAAKGSTTLLIVGFGALTIYFQDQRFIQWKPTIIYVGFGVALLGGWAKGKPLLRYLLEAAFEGLNEDGWLKLSFNWGLFFLALAVLNVTLTYTLSFESWLAAKLWLFMPLSFLFTFTQIPMLLRHGMKLNEDEEVLQNPPHE